MSELCELLEGFCAGWLTEQQRADFETHLEKCVDCASSVRMNQAIDAWLIEGVSAERSTQDLRRRIEQRSRRPVWAPRYSAAAGVAILVMIAGAAWINMAARPALEQTSSPRKAVSALDHPQTGADAAIRDHSSESKKSQNSNVTVQSSNSIVADETTNDRFTIVWLYPTVAGASE